jgi:P-type Cu+ transporter
VASVEAQSDHFLARAIVRRAREKNLMIEGVPVFELIEGKGVKGIVHGKAVLVGNRDLMKMWDLEPIETLDAEARGLEVRGMTVVFFGWDGKVRGILGFGDSLKESARQVIEDLRARRIEILVVSGDSRETTRFVAHALGIDRYVGQAHPRDKVETIKKEQNGGRRVGMVGDGINDAAALAQADVGFALGTVANVAQESSDITLLTEDPARVLDVLRLSGLTMKVIRQNLFFAFFYNGLGIPLAVAGLLNPVIAVLAMFASSLSVIGNSLRIMKEGKVRSSEAKESA